MRLLHSHSRRTEEFPSDEDVPPYAILSHTWGSEEVTLAAWTGENQDAIAGKTGAMKIRLCQQQAVLDRLDWVWIDTCCINKDSSAELSEAINSMFRWYQNAAACYAFLSDVPDGSHLSGDEFAASRWFTRGWTLQELIAPKEVVFYSAGWQRLGTKTSEAGRTNLSKITNIDESYLAGRNLEEASIAKKMSWASGRQTTRREDIAYCLLGIFDISIPLIYGEGKKAFQRLQEEIVHRFPWDHTIFAWGDVITWDDVIGPECPVGLFGHEEFKERGKQAIYSNEEANSPLLSVLAASPAEFKNSASYLPHRSVRNYYSSAVNTSLPRVYQTEVHLHLPRSPKTFEIFNHWRQCRRVTKTPRSELVVLPCCIEGMERSSLHLMFKCYAPEVFGRLRYLISSASDDFGRLWDEEEIKKKQPVRMFVRPGSLATLEHGAIVFVRSPFFVFTWYANPRAKFHFDTGILTSDPAYRGHLLSRHFEGAHSKSFGWAFQLLRCDPPAAHGESDGHGSTPGLPGRVQIRLYRLNLESTKETKEDNGHTWHPTNTEYDDQEGEHSFASHVFRTPRDVWKPAGVPFPLCISLERVTSMDGTAPLTVDFLDVDEDVEGEPRDILDLQWQTGGG